MLIIILCRSSHQVVLGDGWMDASDGNRTTQGSGQNSMDLTVAHREEYTAQLCCCAPGRPRSHAIGKKRSKIDGTASIQAFSRKH